jgi:hypothetical protein
MRCSAWRWLNNPLAPLFSRTELASQLAEAMTLLKEQRQDLLANGVLTRFGNLAPWTVLHLGAALPDSGTCQQLWDSRCLNLVDHLGA